MSGGPPFYVDGLRFEKEREAIAVAEAHAADLDTRVTIWVDSADKTGLQKRLEHRTVNPPSIVECPHCGCEISAKAPRRRVT